MDVGVPKEIKDQEFRVGLSPASVKELCDRNHHVVVETQAGVGAGFSDEDYQAAGATIATSAQEPWAQDMVVKVKEPLSAEYDYLRPDLLLFTYLHLAAGRQLTERLIESGVSAIAYENVEKNGAFPLLAPMSVIAGRLSVQFGARFFRKTAGRTGCAARRGARRNAWACHYFRGRRCGDRGCENGSRSWCSSDDD